MRPIFIKLTNLSGISFWLSVNQIVSLTRISKATYVRCLDDFPDADATNVIRCVVETPEEILQALEAIVHIKPDINETLTNN